MSTVPFLALGRSEFTLGISKSQSGPPINGSPGVPVYLPGGDAALPTKADVPISSGSARPAAPVGPPSPPSPPNINQFVFPSNRRRLGFYAIRYIKNGMTGETNTSKRQKYTKKAIYAQERRQPLSLAPGNQSTMEREFAKNERQNTSPRLQSRAEPPQSTSS